MKKPRNIIAKTYKKFTEIARDMSDDYENVFGLPCDLYYPVRTPKKKGHGYQNVNLLEPHELPVYKPTPNKTDVIFYIPNLFKKESMNSVSDQFDNFALQTQGLSNQPYIECNPKYELPDYTKVVVKIEGSTLSFFVDIKHVVQGAGGHMILRQYLSPLTKDNHIVEGKYEGPIKGTKDTTNGSNKRYNGETGGYLD